MKPLSMISKFTVALGIIIAFASCTSYKEVPYFQNIDQVTPTEVQALYDARIMPKDILTVTVNTTDPMVSAPFNLTTQTQNTSRYSITSQPTLQQYLYFVGYSPLHPKPNHGNRYYSNSLILKILKRSNGRISSRSSQNCSNIP